MKWRERKTIKESEEVVIKEEEGDGAPTNNTDPENFETYATPLFITKRFGRMKEFVIPHEQYKKMRYGRTLGDRWLKFVEDQGLQDEVRKAYHGDEEFLITCDMTGISAVIRKHRLRNQVTLPEE